MSTDLKQLSQKQVSLDKAVPLKSNRLVTFVNHFIVSIADQLNELSSTVDSRLYHLNQQILKCNANLTILEMKLNSMAGLSLATNTATANSSANTVTTNPSANTVSDLSADHEVTASPSPETTLKSDVIETQQHETHEDINTETTNAGPASDETVDKEPIEVDPRVEKYKKMVRLGIPVDAVHQKMRLEGVDTSLLKS